MTHAPFPDRLRLRAAVLQRTRTFFVSRGFLEVQTPLRVRSAGTEPHLAPLSVRGGARGDELRYLITSPELQMKQLLAEGLGAIFQLGPVFRGGELGPLHQPEFTLLEWYRPGTDYRGMMEDTEALVKDLVLGLSLSRDVSWQGRSADLLAPFERLAVDEAFRRFTGAPPPPVATPEGEERFFRLLVEEIEPHLGIGRPCFLMDYPPEQASLARLRPGPRPVAERFELYVCGVELCNAFSELTDAVEQRARMEAELAERARQGLPELPPAREFIAALEQGMPECGGNALGMDRLIMLLAGASAIDEIIALPERP